jgi:hypothetical protein
MEIISGAEELFNWRVGELLRMDYLLINNTINMKKIIFLFVMAGIFLGSCASDPCKNIKDKGDTVKMKAYKTVQSLDSIRKSDTVLIVLNSKTYKVTGIEPRVEEESSTLPVNEMSKASKPNKPCDSELFDGVDRRAAKLSVAPGKSVTYNTLADLIPALPSDADMGSFNIATGLTSKRVAQEKKNVHILKAYIYTYSRESDEDYHVILGTTDNKTTAVFFNMEISGLPASTATAYAKLKATRDAFTGFFGIHGCVSSYVPVFSPPVEVEVTGSVFFDALHYTHHNIIGPKGYNPTSYWEIHPATEIRFK